MDLVWFRDLERLSKTGNFSQAAELGNVSQPAFSRRIRALESWVGTDLVDRRHHPVALTTAGAQMLEASLQALERLENEREQILEAQAVPDKYITHFGAQHSIGWRFFPTWLQAFETAYGPIISRLRADDLQNCMQALRAAEIDFVIGYESIYTSKQIRDRGTESLSIGSDRLIPVCKPDRNRKPLFSLEDLNSPPVPWLRFGDAAPITQHIDPLIADESLGGRLSVVYENTMAGALRIRARDGSGVAWLPHSLVAPDIEAGFLVPTGKDEWCIDLDIRLFRNSENTNRFTRDIWAYLSNRQSLPLVESI